MESADSFHYSDRWHYQTQSLYFQTLKINILKQITTVRNQYCISLICLNYDQQRESQFLPVS